MVLAFIKELIGLNKVKVSRYLCYALRHNPDDLGIVLDKQGWVDVNELLLKVKEKKGINLTLDTLKQIVKEDEKSRYGLKEGKIRCHQGHSIKTLDLHLLELDNPPKYLYHGTSDRYLDSIKDKGLLKGERHHIHLTTNKDTAYESGKRHKGNPIILTIDTQRLIKELNYKFYKSENDVYFVDYIPPNYLVYQ